MCNLSRWRPWLCSPAMPARQSMPRTCSPPAECRRCHLKYTPAAAAALLVWCMSSHVFGEPCKSEYHFTDLDLATATGDHNYISANEKFFAVAVRGGGGPVLVRSWEQYGKVPRGAPTLCGHSSTCILHHCCVLAHGTGAAWHGPALGGWQPL